MARKAGMATGTEVARISVKVSPNTKMFRSELKKDLEQIERDTKGEVHIVARLRTAQAKADFNRLLAQLKAAGAKGVTIRTDLSVDEDRLRRDVDGVQERVDKIVAGGVAKRSGKNSLLNGTPSFGSGINPAGWAVILAAVTVLAAPLMGLITTALLSLPGLVALISAPIAAVTLGLDGMKKAAESIKGPFEELKAVMSAANETAFKPFFQAIADNIFPSLKRSLPAVSEGLAQMAQGFTDAFADPQNLEMFNRSLTKIGDFFTQIRPGIADFTSGFIGLIDQFTDKLPGLGDWFNETGKDFLNWVKEISDGDLSTAFAGLGETLKTILDALGGMGKAGFEFMSDPSKVQDFIEGLESVKDLLVDIVELSNKLAGLGGDQGLFTGLVPDLSWKGFWDDITAPFTSQDAPWRAFGDFFKGGDMKTPAQKLREAGGFDGEEYQTAFNAAAAAVNTGGVIGAGMANTSIGEQVKKQLVDTLQVSKEEQVAALKSALAPDDVGNAVTNQINSQVEAAMVGALQAVEANAGTLQAGLDAALVPLEQLPTKVSEAFQAVAGSMAGFAGPVITAASNAFAQVPPIVEGQLNRIPGVIASSLGAAVGAAVGALGGLIAGVANIMSSVVDQFVAGGGKILAEVATWQGRIEAALAGLYEAGQNAGMQLANGMVAGIQAGAGAIEAAARSAAARASAAAKAELGIKSPSRVFMGIGENTAKGFAQGLENGIQPVIDQAKGLAWQISEAFASGDDPTGFLNGMDKTQVSRVEKVLGFEAKRLELQAKALTYQSKMTGNEALKSQADAIRLKKEEIMLQKDMIGLTREFSDLNGGNGMPDMGNVTDTLLGMPFDFAKAGSDQFMSDLGISGGGAITSLMDYGTQFGQQALGSVFNFNVSSADEAIAIKNNQQYKESLGLVGR